MLFFMKCFIIHTPFCFYWVISYYSNYFLKILYTSSLSDKCIQNITSQSVPYFFIFLNSIILRAEFFFLGWFGLLSLLSKNYFLRLSSQSSPLIFCFVCFMALHLGRWSVVLNLPAWGSSFPKGAQCRLRVPWRLPRALWPPSCLAPRHSERVCTGLLLGSALHSALSLSSGLPLFALIFFSLGSLGVLGRVVQIWSTLKLFWLFSILCTYFHFGINLLICTLKSRCDFDWDCIESMGQFIERVHTFESCSVVIVYLFVFFCDLGVYIVLNLSIVVFTCFWFFSKTCYIFIFQFFFSSE